MMLRVRLFNGIYLFANYRSYHTEEQKVSGSTRQLFRRPHERELGWRVLYDENPWQHRQDSARLKAWHRAADRASTLTTFTVETSAGVHEVDVDLLAGKVTCYRVRLFLFFCPALEHKKLDTW